MSVLWAENGKQWERKVPLRLSKLAKHAFFWFLATLMLIGLSIWVLDGVRLPWEP